MKAEDFERFRWGYSSPEAVKLPPGLRPRQYLEFSVKDLADNNPPRTLINSVSNSKKALHLHVDLLANSLGFPGGRKAPFPQKLSFCNACGIAGSRILAKLNRLRNTMEHEYVVPTKEQAEDYADIVETILVRNRIFATNIPRSRRVYDR